MLYVLIGAGLVVVGGVIAGAYLLQPGRWRRGDSPPELPLTAIADAGEGYVRIAGTVEARTPLAAAPLVSTPCVYYEHLVARERDGLLEPSHELVHAARHGVEFVLRDDSGRALVDPTDALSRLPVHHERTEGGAPRGLAALDPIAVAKPKLRHLVHVIRPGDRVIVEGVAARVADPEAVDAAAPTPTVLWLRHQEGAPLRLSLVDDPRRR